MTFEDSTGGRTCLIPALSPLSERSGLRNDQNLYIYFISKKLG